MGSRYWITGVQLGLLKAWQEIYEHPGYTDDLLTDIEENQFIDDENEEEICGE